MSVDTMPALPVRTTGAAEAWPLRYAEKRLNKLPRPAETRQKVKLVPSAEMLGLAAGIARQPEPDPLLWAKLVDACRDAGYERTARLIVGMRNLSSFPTDTAAWARLRRELKQTCPAWQYKRASAWINLETDAMIVNELPFAPKYPCAQASWLCAVACGRTIVCADTGCVAASFLSLLDKIELLAYRLGSRKTLGLLAPPNVDAADTPQSYREHHGQLLQMGRAFNLLQPLRAAGLLSHRTSPRGAQEIKDLRFNVLYLWFLRLALPQ